MDGKECANFRKGCLAYVRRGSCPTFSRRDDFRGRSVRDDERIQRCRDITRKAAEAQPVGKALDKGVDRIEDRPKERPPEQRETRALDSSSGGRHDAW